jgi:hypothetical protein
MKNDNILKMKTLVIHPDDRSTDFLRAVYKDIPNKTVMTKGHVWDVDLAIESHDRIIMLGHGTPNGLLSVGQFKGSAYVIDSTSAELLSNKKECIFIWCYASDYVKKHNLKGFSSGMFISEVYEANWNGIDNVTKEEVDVQCEYFCNLLGAVVDRPVDQISEFVSREYGEMIPYCRMAEFNHKRLYLAK